MWSDQEKQIFKYHTGAAEQYGDPLAIERKLRALTAGQPGKLAAQTADPELDDASWARAEEKLIQAVREAFEMAPFDKTTGQGATDAMCKRLWNDFWGYLEKKNP